MVTQWGWWAFIIVGPVIYWLLPARRRATCLAIASYLFLAFFAPAAVAVMLALSLAAFAAFEWPDKFGGLLGRIARSPAPILAVLAYLVWSKYVPELAAVMGGRASLFAFAAPLGVSYFAFKLMHYVIERQRGNFPAHTLGDFLCFVFLMPIFTAGPIERFEHFLTSREDAFHVDQLVEGGLRIAAGIVKKFFVGVLVAEAIQRITGGDVLTLIEHLHRVSPQVVWAYLFLTLLYIYLDFSAYSDIAIGASRLFGLRIMENFNLPFIATDLRKYWLRWHMTLALWCRTYIYMAIVGVTRNPYWAVIAAFVVMGVWHAGWPLQWVLWGVWHGVGCVVVLAWSRYAMRRKIRLLDNPVGVLAGWALTMGYVALGGAFTALYGRAPLADSLRLIGRAFALPV
jgi:alginate O-acetyltransferase complex protein AlgI